MFELWADVSGLPAGSAGGPDFPAVEGDGSDAVFAGIELRGGPIDVGSLGSVHEQEQRLSNGADDSRGGAWDEADPVDAGVPDLERPQWKTHFGRYE